MDQAREIGALMTQTDDATRTSFFDGILAEWWTTNTDIQPDGGQLSNQTLIQLSRGGPFSLPHIRKDIAEYRSMRLALGSKESEPPDYFMGNKGRQIWTNNGATLAVHPPLASSYKGTTDIIRTGIV